MRQLPLRARTWGGAREGAGRPRIHADDGAAHRRRKLLDGRRVPVHVTLRVRKHVWGLRRSFRVVERALRSAQGRFETAIVHFSVQGNHVHLIVESSNERRLASAMKGLSIRLAKAMNRTMGARGPVIEDRYHTHYLATPTEVKNALRYVLTNHIKHFGGARHADPCSSLANPAMTAAPRTWMLARIRLVI
jgi:REP element-mobilizing transposase RayT